MRMDSRLLINCLTAIALGSQPIIGNAAVCSSDSSDPLSSFGAFGTITIINKNHDRVPLHLVNYETKSVNTHLTAMLDASIIPWNKSTQFCLSANNTYEAITSVQGEINYTAGKNRAIYSFKPGFVGKNIGTWESYTTGCANTFSVDTNAPFSLTCIDSVDTSSSVYRANYTYIVQ